jgi:hypothetical protein
MSFLFFLLVSVSDDERMRGELIPPAYLYKVVAITECSQIHVELSRRWNKCFHNPALQIGDTDLIRDVFGAEVEDACTRVGEDRNVCSILFR